MQPPREPSAPDDPQNEEKMARLQEENAQLRQAVDSHAVIDQAIGVLMAVRRVPPADGWHVLREVSQHANVRLHAVADEVTGWTLGERPMSAPVRKELEAALQRWRLRNSYCLSQENGHA
ncbi:MULTISPECIES: ANTAR domain-containing protein [unclassified Streptomyces]|uniref:ANTAR domain-containing protein n=1 Tax=unclassified Streptomyces TaxID=2593676 RepID=UPI0037F9E72A